MRKIPQNLSDRHVPERTCIGCLSKRPKKDLLRIVIGAIGQLEPDVLQRKPGRAVYLCHTRACFIMAKQKKRFSKHLRKSISLEAIQTIEHLFVTFE